MLRSYYIRILVAPSLFILLIWGVLNCGGSEVGSTVSTIEFNPNPATLSSGICTSQAAIVALSGEDVTLVSLTANFMDPNGMKTEIQMNTEELTNVLSTNVLPGRSLTQGSFSFDLSSDGLISPADGVVVILGVGTGGSTQFVGNLRCEA